MEHGKADSRLIYSSRISRSALPSSLTSSPQHWNKGLIYASQTRKSSVQA